MPQILVERVDLRLDPTLPIVWMRVGPLMWDTMTQLERTEVLAHFASILLVGIAIAKFHSVCIIADRIQRSAIADTEFEPRASRISSNDSAFRTNAVCLTSALQGEDGDAPVKKGDYDRGEPNSPFANAPNEELICELLDREASVRPEPAENQVEQDLVPIVDLHVGVARGAVPQNRPAEGLKSLVSKRSGCLCAPSSTRNSCVGVH